MTTRGHLIAQAARILDAHVGEVLREADSDVLGRPLLDPVAAEAVRRIARRQPRAHALLLGAVGGHVGLLAAAARIAGGEDVPEALWL